MTQPLHVPLEVASNAAATDDAGETAAAAEDSCRADVEKEGNHDDEVDDDNSDGDVKTWT